ncbi:MAG: hypothetical protein NVSMB62_20810 [Acidobacteriaceae bacterium]
MERLCKQRLSKNNQHATKFCCSIGPGEGERDRPENYTLVHLLRRKAVRFLRERRSLQSGP